MADSSDHQMEGVEDATLDKGKGKALQVHDASMESAEDDSSDESAAEEQGGEAEPEEEDNLEEIDPSVILPKRTRGKEIDYAKAAEAEGMQDDDDEDDDEDFQDPDDQMKD